MDSGSRERRGRIATRQAAAGEAGTTAGSSAAGSRGQTAVVAIVLLVGLVAVGSIGILLLGGQANQEGKQRAEAERVEQAFLELDRDVDSVGRSEAGERTVDLDLPAGSDAAVREEVAGQIWINRTNFTTKSTTVLVNRSIGSIRYTSDDGRTLAFQAGGVWKEEGNNTRMVSPPAISYDLDKNGNGPTLTVPIVTTSGDTRLEGGQVRVRKNRTVAPVNDQSIVENDLITMKVQSRWYVGWAEYFRQLTSEQAVTVDHANNTATVEMIVPAVAPTVQSGLFSGTANAGLKMKQDGNKVDSYDSSTGPYSGGSGEGKVVVAGDLTLQQNSQIRGDVEVGGDVTFQQTSNVTGNLSYAPSSSLSPSDPTTSGPPHVAGWKAPNASIRSRTPVDGYIDLNVGSIKENNNNASESGDLDDIESSSDDCDPCRLKSGSYYLKKIELDGTDELILNTTGGPISLAVNRTIDIQDDTVRVRIIGNGRVNVFVNGLSAGGDPEFSMASGAKWLVEDDRAPQSWVYFDSDADVAIKQGSVFVGVIYGPGTASNGGAEVTLKQDAQVFGAVVGDIDPLTQNISVHYDRALQNAVPVTTNVAIPRLTFLHVAVHEVEVEEED